MQFSSEGVPYPMENSSQKDKFDKYDRKGRDYEYNSKNDRDNFSIREDRHNNRFNDYRNRRNNYNDDDHSFSKDRDFTRNQSKFGRNEISNVKGKSYSSKYQSFNKRNDEKEEPYRILIHNLPMNINAQDLNNFIKEKLGEIHYVGFKLFDSFAYFTVASRIICNEAYSKLEGQKYKDNKLVLLKDKLSVEDIESNDYWKALVAEKRGSTLFTGRTRKVFVGNLPYNIKSYEVKKFFETKCGPIDDFRMSRGCCFIRFVNAKPSVHLALDYRDKEVFGRRIRVEEELDDSDRPGRGRRQKTSIETSNDISEKNSIEKSFKVEPKEMDFEKTNNENSSSKNNLTVQLQDINDSDEEDYNNSVEVKLDVEDEEVDEIEYEDNNSKRKQKFLTEEELKKRKRHFEEVETLFPKKKRRKKLIEKIEKSDAFTYINEKGEKSFIHNKKSSKEEEMPIEELFVFDPPKKIIRNGVVEEVNIKISQPEIEADSSSLNNEPEVILNKEQQHKKVIFEEIEKFQQDFKPIKKFVKENKAEELFKHQEKKSDNKQVKKDKQSKYMKNDRIDKSDNNDRNLTNFNSKLDSKKNNSKFDKMDTSVSFESKNLKSKTTKYQSNTNDLDFTDEKLYHTKKSQSTKASHPDDIVEVVAPRSFKWTNKSS